MSSNAAVHRFEYDGWHVVIKLEALSVDGFASGHADLKFKGQHRCRIALNGQFNDGASAIKSLAERARGFVDDWDIRRAENAAPFIDQ
jgi:hypothetical protein